MTPINFRPTHVVVELGLGNRVVDVDGGDLELAVTEELVKVVDTGGGLLRDTLAVLEVLGVLVVDKRGKVSSVVEDQVEGLALWEGSEGLLDTPLVLLLGLTLPGKDGDTGSGNSSGGVVLGGEDVARRPGDLGTESSEGLDEDSGLDGPGLSVRLIDMATHCNLHVETSDDPGALEDLLLGVLLTEVHESGHLSLSELDLLAAEGGEGDVSDFVGGHFD